jgi:hypothetical protein
VDLIFRVVKLVSCLVRVKDKEDDGDERKERW